MKFPFSRFVVFEESMLPAYRPGERVLTLNWMGIKKGDAVVFNLGGKHYIKRVYKISGDFVSVSGDNKRRSSKFGPVKKKQIIGKVILKY